MNKKRAFTLLSTVALKVSWDLQPYIWITQEYLGRKPGATPLHSHQITLRLGWSKQNEFGRFKGVCFFVLFLFFPPGVLSPCPAPPGLCTYAISRLREWGGCRIHMKPTLWHHSNQLKYKHKRKRKTHPNSSKFLPEPWISFIIHGEGGSMWGDSTRAGTGRTPSLWFEPWAGNLKLACSSHAVHLLLILSSS